MSKSNKSHKKDKAVVGGSVKLIVLFRNWAHQGFTYLDRTEMFYRVIWELVPFCIIFYLFVLTGISWWCNIVLSFLLAHTLNWVLNDNMWTCIQFTLPNLLNPGNEKTKLYLVEMQKRMQNNKAVGGCMIYGSMSRGVWKNKSDLDIRILRKPGILNGFKGYWACWVERLIAVRNKQPLDIYLADSIDFLKKMRDDEFPIFLKGNDKRLVEVYGNFQIADFTNIDSLNELARSCH